MIPAFFSSLLHQASAQGSRSTVLRPLGWLLAISGAIVIALIGMRADFWVSCIFVAISTLAAALYMGAYIYCLFVDRDALRSETYSIQKLAIQKGFIGDNFAGLLEGARFRHVLEETPREEEKK